MKQPDSQPCALCGQSVLHTDLPLFFRLHIETMGANTEAIQRQIGFAQCLGNHALAYHRGAQEDLAHPLFAGTTLLLCHRCIVDPEKSFTDLLAAVDAASVDKKPESHH